MRLSSRLARFNLAWLGLAWLGLADLDFGWACLAWRELCSGDLRRSPWIALLGMIIDDVVSLQASSGRFAAHVSGHGTGQRSPLAPMPGVAGCYYSVNSMLP